MYTVWLLLLSLRLSYDLIHAQAPVSTSLSAVQKKICVGRAEGQTHTAWSPDRRYEVYRQTYSNCTVVMNSLELLELPAGRNYSWDFLDSIEEVYGYVLIYESAVSHLSLRNLRVIYGNTLHFPMTKENRLDGQAASHFKRGLALTVIRNTHMTSLSMPNLKIIEKGSVMIISNPRLCYIETIDWSQILGTDHAERLFHAETPDREHCRQQVARNNICEHCGADNPHCWGSELSDCQDRYRSVCAPQCDGFCFGAGPLDCCHRECLAGCSGPKASDCHDCKTIRLNATCVDRCPSAYEYSGRFNKVVATRNRNVYAYARTCVDECPPHTYVFERSAELVCVQECPEGYYVENRTRCVSCGVGSACPKECRLDRIIDADNIKELYNCTLVHGDVLILTTTVTGHHRLVQNGSQTTLVESRPLSMMELRRALAEVRVITGSLQIEVDYATVLKNGLNVTDFEVMDLLPKLAIIEGHTLIRSIFIMDIGFGPWKRVDLKSLRQLGHEGKVLITGNPNLCYIDSIDWKKFGAAKFVVKQNGDNDTCLNADCHTLCEPSSGCWGPGADECVACSMYRQNGTCVQGCDTSLFFTNEDAHECEACHAECDRCDGTTENDCTRCRHYEDDGRCVQRCPLGKYPDPSGQCKPCHALCHNGACTGPNSFAGPDGCDVCTWGVLKNNVIECLPNYSRGRSCSDVRGLHNFYRSYPGQMPVEETLCRECPAECKSCTSASTSSSDCECSYFLSAATGMCVMECPTATYQAVIDGVRQCLPCHEECDQRCTGPSSTQCVACRHSKVRVLDKSRQHSGEFNCTAECPASLPFNDGPDRICMAYDVAAVREKNMKLGTGLGVAIGLAVILFVFGLGAFHYKRRLTIKQQLMDYLKPPLELGTFKPNPDARPNMAHFVLINEDELSYEVEPLGYGAFGTVHKGFWKKPAADKPLAVAIKRLHDPTTDSVNEMLDEACTLASIRHRHLVSFLGVCMSEQHTMLVTELVPLGNLLRYLQKNREKIYSATLLNWASQLADGMAHLEEHRVVHRDLAARNVLVASSHNSVFLKICDFGLARMMDYGENQLIVASGKMPLKWLALECIQYKRFTHKSDVWAYGVTLWEMFTYGAKPYEHVNKAEELLDLLQKGERLSQPSMCTLDVYTLMISCWMFDSDSRPSFVELRQSFRNMLQDPARFLSIKGDPLFRAPAIPGHSAGSSRASVFLNSADTLPADHDTNTIDFKKAASSRKPHALNSTSSTGSTGTSTAHRYASDPLKGLMDGSGSTMESLMADNDNYLVPNADYHSRSSASTYTDVVQTPIDPFETPPPYYNDLPPLVPRVAPSYWNNPPSIDNALYIDNSSAKPPPLIPPVGVATGTGEQQQQQNETVTVV